MLGIARLSGRPIASAGAGGGGWSPADASPVAWYRIAAGNVFTDAARTTASTPGNPVGGITDLSGNGAHASQGTASLRPGLPAAGYRLRSDFSDDFITATIGACDRCYINTPYGWYRSDAQAGTHRLPLNDATEIIYFNGAVDEAELAAYFGTPRRFMVALLSGTTISNLRIYKGGGSTNIHFTGANGATVTKALSASSNSSFDLASDGLTGPVGCAWDESLIGDAALQRFYCYFNQLTGSIPSLAGLTALQDFRCYFNQLTGSIPSLAGLTALQYFLCDSNQLTGSIPSLAGLTALQTFYCFSNQLTGSIPSLAGLTALRDFRCYFNQLTGSIPSLAGLTALQYFLCYSNQLTGYTDSTVPASLTDFRAQTNALTQSAINALLVDFDDAGASGAYTFIANGGTNAAPSGAGLTAKANLQSKGWTVTTN